MPQCPVCNSQLVKFTKMDGYGCPFCGWTDGVERSTDVLRKRREAGKVPEHMELCSSRCPTCDPRSQRSRYDLCIYWKSHSNWRKFPGIDYLPDEERLKYGPGTYWLQYHRCLNGHSWRRAQRGYLVVR